MKTLTLIGIDLAVSQFVQGNCQQTPGCAEIHAYFGLKQKSMSKTVLKNRPGVPIFKFATCWWCLDLSENNYMVLI